MRLAKNMPQGYLVDPPGLIFYLKLRIIRILAKITDYKKNCAKKNSELRIIKIIFRVPCSEE
jgi:hypothetical protein